MNRPSQGRGATDEARRPRLTRRERCAVARRTPSVAIDGTTTPDRVPRSEAAPRRDARSRHQRSRRSRRDALHARRDAEQRCQTQPMGLVVARPLSFSPRGKRREPGRTPTRRPHRRPRDHGRTPLTAPQGPRRPAPPWTRSSSSKPGATRRAAHLRKAHFARLALKSAQSRRKARALADMPRRPRPS